MRVVDNRNDFYKVFNSKTITAPKPSSENAPARGGTARGYLPTRGAGPHGLAGLVGLVPQCETSGVQGDEDFEKLSPIRGERIDAV